MEYYGNKPPHPNRVQGGLRTRNELLRKYSQNEPLVSIITIVYNKRDQLKRTIKSVLSQTYENIEYIIVDGGSTDGAIDVIRQYEHSIDYWISEPDEGISDAFNKGLEISWGDWILFLNADDTFIEENALKAIASHFAGRQIVTGFAQYGRRILPYYVPKKNDDLRIRACIAHQASLVHRSVFERFGGFDTSFKIRMDYDFWLRVLPYVPAYFVQEVFINYSEGGTSNKNKWTYYIEEMRANKKNTGTYNILHWLKFRNIIFISFEYLKNILKSLSLVKWRAFHR